MANAERPASAPDAAELAAIAAVRRGDPSAYDVLVGLYMRRVLSIAWGLVRNAHDAEDLAQEAFVKAFEKMPSFREGEPFGPWIFRIVTNLSLDLLKHRRRVRQEEISEAQPAGRETSADVATFSGELSQRIDAAIESLPGMQRVVARLYLVEQFGHAEIAAMTSLSEGTIRSHLSLGRRKLQEMLYDLKPDGTP